MESRSEITNRARQPPELSRGPPGAQRKQKLGVSVQTTHTRSKMQYEPSVGRTRASVVKTNKASKTPNVSQTECGTTIHCSKIAQLYSRTWLLGRPSGPPSLFHSGLLVVGEPCRMTAGERWCGTRDGREAGKPVQNAFFFSSLEGFLHPTLL